MKLSTIFSQLETSELNQLSCVDTSTGKVKPEKYQAIVDVLNQGLVDLHTRFKLRVGQVVIPILPEVDTYDLAATDKTVKGRFLQLHDVRDDCGNVVPVGSFEPYSVSFISPMLMMVPEYMRKTFPVKSLTIQFRALPTKIQDCFGDIDPEMVEVDLPQAYIGALCWYLASRLHTPVGLQDGTYRPNAFLGLYNAECTRLTEANLGLDYQKDLGHLRRGGWA